MRFDRSNAAIPKNILFNSTTIYSHPKRLCKIHFKIIKRIIEYIKLSDENDNDDDKNERRRLFKRIQKQNSAYSRCQLPLIYPLRHRRCREKCAELKLASKRNKSWHFILRCITDTSCKGTLYICMAFFLQLPLPLSHSTSTCFASFCTFKTHNPIASTFDATEWGKRLLFHHSIHFKRCTNTLTMAKYNTRIRQQTAKTIGQHVKIEDSVHGTMIQQQQQYTHTHTPEWRRIDKKKNGKWSIKCVYYCRLAISFRCSALHVRSVI